MESMCSLVQEMGGVVAGMTLGTALVIFGSSLAALGDSWVEHWGLEPRREMTETVVILAGAATIAGSFFFVVIEYFFGT